MPGMLSLRLGIKCGLFSGLICSASFGSCGVLLHIGFPCTSAITSHPWVWGMEEAEIQ